MTFTELEYVLMLAVAVLLWRSAVMRTWAQSEEYGGCVQKEREDCATR